MSDVTERAGRFFESYAHQFDEIYKLQHQRGLLGWLNRKFRACMLIRYERTFEALSPMERHSVLDVGCGSGRYLVRSLELGAQSVTGIDLSEEMLSISKQWLGEIGQGSEKAVLLSGDFLTHEFDQVFDFGIVMGVMDYIEDPGPFIEKLSRVVRWKAVLSFPISESVLALQRKIRYRLRDCPLFLYERNELEELIEASPFSKCSLEQIHRDYFVTLEH